MLRQQNTRIVDLYKNVCFWAFENTQWFLKIMIWTIIHDILFEYTITMKHSVRSQVFSDFWVIEFALVTSRGCYWSTFSRLCIKRVLLNWGADFNAVHDITSLGCMVTNQPTKHNDMSFKNEFFLFALFKLIL